MGLLANPWIIIGLLLSLAASHGLVGYKAYHAGEEHVIAENLKLVDAETRTRDAALAVTSDAIAKIKVENVTVRQKAETITRERVVYRDCQHDADGLRLINEALTGQAKPVADGKLPAPDANN